MTRPDHDLTALRARLERCEQCELFRDATQVVPGDGPPDATLMVVGEQPGDREDLAGEPFVGPAGQVLDEALEAAGLSPAEVYRTNAVKHFRFEQRGKRRIHQTPLRRHIVACEPWLEAEVAAVRPLGAVLLGATAGQAVYGAAFRVGAARGSVRPWPSEGGPWAVATIHPSAVLRARGDRDATLAGLVADLRVAADEVRSGRRE